MASSVCTLIASIAVACARANDRGGSHRPRHQGLRPTGIDDSPACARNTTQSLGRRGVARYLVARPHRR
jgi:hypothetical protein